MSIIYILDLIGTFAFALSGAITASNKKFDLFGVIIIAFITAVGGGMLRDLLIDAHPVNWIGDSNYIWVIVLAVMTMYSLKSKIAPWAKTFFIFDTIGLGVFTLIGTQKGLSYGLAGFPAIVMGMISACFGGVIRDVLTNKVPLIFKKEIYASACLAGGIVFLIINYFNFDERIIAYSTIGTVVFIRLIAVAYHLELPKINKDIFGNKI
ncbi:MAG: trimeric intracellular cation channel family protein [Flavobacteriaceae bacterium]